MRTMLLVAPLLLAVVVSAHAATSYYQEGLKLMQAERYDEAVVAFEKENAENPGSAEVLMNLGWSYWKVNRIDDAWRVFDLLARLDPKNAGYLRMLAETEISRKEYPHALEHAQQSLRLLPGDKDSSIVLSSALIGLQRHQEADRILRDLVERYPDSAAVQFHMADNLAAMGRLEESLQHFDITMRLAPDNHDFRRARANVLYALGNHGAAVAEWKALADLNPPDQKSIINLGWAAWQDKALEEAYKYGMWLLKLDPENPTYLKFVGSVQLERGQPPDALRLAQHALDILGEDKDAALIKAKALFNLHRDREAMAVLRDLITRYPQDQRIVFSMADFLEGMGRYQESLTLFNRLIKQYPDNLVYQYRRAGLMYAMEDFDAAVAEWKGIIKRYPAEVKALQYLADDAISRDSWDEALLYVQEEAGRQPLDADTWLRLATIYQQLKSYPLAVSAADKASKLSPDNQDALYLKADAYVQMNDLKGAEKVYYELLQKNPNNYRTLEALEHVSEAENDYDRAIKLVETERKVAFSDSSSSPYLDIYEARLLADEGHIERAMRVLTKKATHQRISIPVLLYRGVSRVKRGEPRAVPKLEFDVQMRALEKAGYHPITVAQLAAYWDGKGSLPEKPILITFDDARAETVDNADPVLKAHHLQATAFDHFEGGFGRSRFYPQPDQLKEWAGTGRWEIQTHSEQAHDMVAVDRAGTKGHYLSNRLWLPQKNRLETEAEFNARVDADFKVAHQNMQALLPETKMLAYGFPFGDMGQTDFSNAPEAPLLNWQAAHRYFKFTFTEDPHGFNRVPTRVTDLHRYEVKRDMSERDLMQHLVMDEPYIKARMQEADFWVRTDQPGRALSIYASLRNDYHVDEAGLYGAEARAFDMFGNGYHARQEWSDALDRDPSEQRYRDFSSYSQAKDEPNVGSTGRYFSDPFTRNTTVDLLASAPVKAARVQGFVGRSVFDAVPGTVNGQSAEANEYGGNLRWFLMPRVRLDADFTRRDFTSGVSRRTNNANGQVTFPFFAPFRLGVGAGISDVVTTQAIGQGLFFRAYRALADWDMAMNTTLSLNYEKDRYSDSNTGQVGSALLSRKFGTYWTLGYNFTYLATDRTVVEYYSPRRASLNTGLVTFGNRFGPMDERRNINRGTGSITYSAGYGVQDGAQRVIQGVKGTVGYRVVGDLSLNFSAAYSQSPAYVSRTLFAGLGLDL